LVNTTKNSINNLPPLREVIRDNDLRADKKFGQNFLLDGNLTDKIVRAASDLKDCTAFEIGPGPGGLTRSLLRGDAKKVIAIEFDPRVIVALDHLKESAGERFVLHHNDALTVDLKTMSDSPRAIIANLPYNIATPLLIGWLSQIREDHDSFRSMTLMFQKEVAQRITAKVGDKHYGRLAVLCQWLCDVQKSFDVPASAFTPPPKVTSSIAHFKPKKLDSDAPQFETIEKITAAAFGQRRKMIRSSLKQYAQYFDYLGLRETDRAENLSVDDFVNLAKAVEKKQL